MLREHRPSDDDGFEAMMRNAYSHDVSPREMIDPSIKDVLDAAASLEAALNDANSGIGIAEAAERIASINDQWQQLGLFDATVYLTGRVEPIGKKVSEASDESSSRALGRTHIDRERGVYYDATALAVALEEFSIQYSNERYTVVANIGSTGDETGMRQFIAPQGGIEYIETPTITPEGAEIILRRDYPELYLALQTLPEGSDDLARVQQSLSDFIAVIDPLKCKVMLTREELVNLVEEHMARRLSFDPQATYTVGINGSMYRYDDPRAELIAGEECNQQFSNVRLDRVRLHPIVGRDNGYTPLLQIRYVDPEKGITGPYAGVHASDIIQLSKTDVRLAPSSWSDKKGVAYVNYIPERVAHIVESIDSLAAGVATEWSDFLEEVRRESEGRGDLTDEQRRQFFIRTTRVLECGETKLFNGDMVSTSSNCFLVGKEAGGVFGMQLDADENYRVCGVYDRVGIEHVPLSAYMEADDEVDETRLVRGAMFWISNPTLLMRDGRQVSFTNKKRLAITLQTPNLDLLKHTIVPPYGEV